MANPNRCGNVSESESAVDKDTGYKDSSGLVADRASDGADQHDNSSTSTRKHSPEVGYSQGEGEAVDSAAANSVCESGHSGRLYRHSTNTHQQHSQTQTYTHTHRNVPDINLQIPTRGHRRTYSTPVYSLSPALKYRTLPSHGNEFNRGAHGERLNGEARTRVGQTDYRADSTSPLSLEMSDTKTDTQLSAGFHSPVQSLAHTRTLRHTQSHNSQLTKPLTPTQPQPRAHTPNRCSGNCRRDSLAPSAHGHCVCTPTVVGVHSLDTKRQQRKMSSINNDYGTNSGTGPSPAGLGSGRPARGRPTTHITGANPGTPGSVVGRTGNAYQSRSDSGHRRHSMTTTLQETHFSMLKWHSPQTGAQALNFKGRRVSDANPAGLGVALAGSSSESDAQPYLELARELVRLDLFAGTSSEFLSVLADNFVPKTYRRGDQIVMFGETGVTMFYLFQGTVDVMSGDREVSYTRLSDGAIFGEIALLLSVPRTATIIAVEKCICFVLNKEKLNAILKDYPEEAKKIREVGARRYALYQSQNSSTEKQATRRNTDPSVAAREWGGSRRPVGAMEHGAADKPEAILKLGLSPNANKYSDSEGEGSVISQVNVLHDLSMLHAHHPHSMNDIYSRSSNSSLGEKASRGLGNTLDVQLGSTNDPRKIASASVERSQVYMTSPAPIANRANSTGPTGHFSCESSREEKERGEAHTEPATHPHTSTGAGASTDTGANASTDEGAGASTDTGANASTDEGAGASTDTGAGASTDKGAGTGSPTPANKEPVRATVITRRRHNTQDENLMRLASVPVFKRSGNGSPNSSPVRKPCKSESLDTYNLSTTMSRSESSPSGTMFDSEMTSSGVVVGAGDALGRTSVGHHRSSSRSSVSMLKRHSSSDPFKRSTSEINLKSMSATDTTGTHPSSASSRYNTNTNFEWGEPGDGSSVQKYDRDGTNLYVDENSGGSSPNNFRSPLARAHRARDFNRIESHSEDRSRNIEGQGRGSVEWMRRPLESVGRTNSDSQVSEARGIRTGLESGMAAMKVTDNDIAITTTAGANGEANAAVVAQLESVPAQSTSQEHAQMHTDNPGQTPHASRMNIDTDADTGTGAHKGNGIEESSSGDSGATDNASGGSGPGANGGRRLSIDESDCGETQDSAKETRAAGPSGELESASENGSGVQGQGIRKRTDRAGAVDSGENSGTNSVTFSEDDSRSGSDAEGLPVGYNGGFDIGEGRRRDRRMSMGPDKVIVPEEAANTSISCGIAFHKTPVDRIRSAAIRKRSPSIAVFSSEIQEQLRNMDFSASTSHTPSNLSSESSTVNAHMDTPIMDSEFMAKVLSYLSVGDRYKCMAVCHKWKDIAQSDVVWYNSSFAEQNRLVNDDVLVQVMASYGEMVCNLSLKNCWAVSDEGLEAIALKANLNEISLFSCWEVSSAGLQMLGEHCKNIQHINLNNCRKITDVGMMHLTNNCIGLRSIQLSYCKNLTEVTLNYILARCRKLQHLNIHRCSSISNEGMKLFRQHPAHQLLILNLSDCFDIDDDALEDIIAGCDILEDITLSFCSQLTTDAMSTLSKCSTMKRMDLSSCGNAVNDTGVKKLIEGDIVQSLTFLNLRNCYGLTGAGLRCLDEKCPKLEYVNITNLKKITAEDIQACTNIKKIENVAPLDLTRAGSPLAPRKGLQAGNNRPEAAPEPTLNIPRRTFGPA